MLFKIFTLLFTFFALVAKSHSIDISSESHPINILKHTSIYLDIEHKHNFEYILQKHKNLFHKNTKKNLDIGYSSDAIWLKFTLRNSSKTKIHKVLEISNQMLDEIILYTKEKNTYKKTVQGILHLESFHKNILHPYFDISLDVNETKEYYLQTYSLSSAIYFNLDLMNKERLYEKEISHQLVLTLFFGAIIALILYNQFIFFFTKDLAYLYYVLYLFFVLLNHLSYTGMTIYILPESLYNIDIHMPIAYLCFISIFALLFMREFLQLKDYNYIDLLIKLFIAINIFFIVFSSQNFYPLDIVGEITFTSLVYILGIGFYILHKNKQNAKYIVIGWSVAICGWLMLALYNYGYWSIIKIFPYFYELCIFSEAILFSIALANKLNKTKKLQKSLLSNKILTKELHHRVKNNMQFIISIYRLKLAKYSNKHIHNSLEEVERAIQAISDTHEMLYRQDLSDTIDTQEYLSKLIFKIQQSYNKKNIKIKLNVHGALKTNDAIYVGIIVNELVTNAYKHAFRNKDNGKINIYFSLKNKQYKLVVEDNGTDFKQDISTNTFGIELIQALVTDELNGKIDIKRNNGFKYLIVW